MSYSHFNLYVGKYDVAPSGHVPLPDARLRAERSTETPEGLELRPGGEKIALILEDGNFWPMIALLTSDEAERVGRRLSLLGHAAKIGLTI